jgi:cytochrome c556
MQDAVAKLNTVAKGGDKAAIKVAFGDAGGTCKACHDDYRAK